MSTKIGELRETLIDAIYQIKAGKMCSDDANAIARLAGAINQNLSVEIQAMKVFDGLSNKKTEIGMLPMGEEMQAKKLMPPKIKKGEVNNG